MSDDDLITRVVAWRLVARYLAEQPGDHSMPSRDEWADLADLMSELTCLINGEDDD
jgi:hypothetical protein